MNTERESHVVPALVAIVGVVAFAILVYLFFEGMEWLFTRAFGGTGTPF